MSHHSTTGPQKRCGLPGNSLPVYRTAWNQRSLLKLCPFLVALPHFPHVGCRWLRWPKPFRTLAFPGAQSMSKGSHASHTGLLSAPPAHYNVPAWGLRTWTFLSLSCFSTRLSHGWLLSILQFSSLKKLLPPHSNNASGSQLFYHVLGFIFFIIHNLKKMCFHLFVLSSISFNLKKIFLMYLFFNWRIITLQNCVCFCQTSTRISQRYTYVPFLLHSTHLNYLFLCILFSPLTRMQLPWWWRSHQPFSCR